MKYQNNFVTHARQLRNKGNQLGQLHQMGKSGGLAVTVLSGLGLVASGGTLLPLIFGAVTYGAAVLSENKRTGKLKPLPFIDDDLAGIAARSLHQQSPSSLGTQAHHYLEPEDKALYYLTNFQGHRLTQLAAQMEPDQFEHVLVNLIDHLVTAHQAALNHPELLGNALNTSFIDDAIAALPQAISQEIPHAQPAPVLVPAEPEAPAVGSDTRLAAVDVPATPVEPCNVLSHDDVLDLLGLPLVLVWGGQGSGKTTCANWLAYTAVERGYIVAVADPDYRLGDWPELPVFGKGGNYAECDALLQSAMDECDRRYRERATKGTDTHQFEPILYVLEEFTNWSGECSQVASFIKKAVQKFRKVNIHVLMISHGRTLTATGGAKGLAETFRNGSVQLELMSKPTKVDGKTLPRPSGQGRLTINGEEGPLSQVPNLKDWTRPAGLSVKQYSLGTNGAVSNSNLAKDSDENFGCDDTPNTDVFTVAIERIRSGDGAVTEFTDLSTDALVRLVLFLQQNRRGQSVTVRDVTGNKANREAGLSASDKIRDALELMVYMDVAKPSEDDEAYPISP